MSKKAKPKAEIIPPDKQDEGDASATSRAGARLRMPPMIDNAGARDICARLITRPLAGMFAATAAIGRGLIGGLVYRLTLVTLVGTALGVTGYGIWQARHISLPQFDGFWFNTDVASELGESATPVASIDRSVEQDFTPSGNLADLQRDLRALEAPSPPPSADRKTGQAVTMNDAANKAAVKPSETDQALTALRRQYAALQEKYAALLAAHGALDDGAQENLTARVALGDLLLRLDNGAAFDDLLEGGALARVLRRSEWSLLALYADSGIPTRPALLTRFELWVANTANMRHIMAGQDQQAARGFYATMIDWLRRRADGLVTVRDAPLATAEGDIAMIADALGRGRHDEAAWRMGALLRRMESDSSVNHPDAISLQLLYDDTRAAAELSPMLAALRDDYMSGARP